MAAYGAIDTGNGNVDPRTVADSKIGAMVNWLYLNGMTVTNMTPDSYVRAAFKAAGHLVKLAEIEITVIRQVEPD